MEPWVYPVENLELRRRGGRGGGRSLSGSFRYGSRATMRDRGKLRKEMFAPRAFQFAVEAEERDIHLLAGHSFSQPLASKKAGSLILKDTDRALQFEAKLPEEALQPSWMRDTILAVKNGLIGGISPGFKIPPKSAVSNAEELIPEKNNPGVYIRLIKHALLYELSLVTRPAYPDTALDLRQMDISGDGVTKAEKRAYLWL